MRAPDHPLLLQDADVLAGGAEELTAFFTPSSAERERPTLLKSRLILNRLALPLKARCVLVTEAEDFDIAHQLSGDFDAVVEWHRRTAAARVAESHDVDARRVEMSVPAVTAAQQQFSNAMTVMQLVARISNRPFTSAYGEPTPEPDEQTILSPRRTARSTREISSDFFGVPLAESYNGVADRPAMRRLINNQTERRYGLDGGVPYALGGAPGIVLVDDWPHAGRDPQKVIHASAFGGWAFVLKSHRHELQRLAERLSRNL